MSGKQSQDVYDRLYDKKSYTGVYAQRFVGDGRVNGDSDLSVKTKNVTGSTGDKSDVIIRDISEITRSNLRSAGGRKKAAGRARDPAPEQSEDGSLNVDEQLRRVFDYYCRFGRTSKDADSIDNANFAKFARECPNLLDRAVTPTEVDLIFTKAKPKFARRLDYSHWLDALSAIGAKRYPDADPTTAFTYLLAHHVLHCPPASGRAPPRRARVEGRSVGAAGAGGTGSGAGAGAGRPRRTDADEDTGAEDGDSRSGGGDGGGSDRFEGSGAGSREGEGGAASGASSPPAWPPQAAGTGGGREVPAAATGAPAAALSRAEAPVAPTIDSIKVPLRPLGFRLVSSGGPVAGVAASEEAPEFPSVVLEAFLDLCCPFSARLYQTVVEEVLPGFPAGHVEFVFHPWVQPWHPQSTMMAEVALAVGALDPEAFFPFCSRLFDHQAAFFDDRVYDRSRREVNVELAAVAEGVGVNASSVLDAVALTGKGNCGTAVTQALKYYTRFGRQNSVHASPTVVINGLVDNAVSSSWTAAQWREYLLLFLDE